MMSGHSKSYNSKYIHTHTHWSRDEEREKEKTISTRRFIVTMSFLGANVVKGVITARVDAIHIKDVSMQIDFDKFSKRS